MLLKSAAWFMPEAPLGHHSLAEMTASNKCQQLQTQCPHIFTSHSIYPLFVNIYGDRMIQPTV